MPEARELSTEEGLRFLRDVAGFGSPSPILVMTGGDPLARCGSFTMLEQAKRRAPVSRSRLP